MYGMWDPASRWISVIISLWLFVGCQGNGNIGCLFSGSLCSDRLEWCYDDYAFGRCLQIYASTGNDETYRYDLDRHALHALEREMQRLFALGYRWSHTYTQCVLQGLLHAIRYGLDYDRAMCDHLIDQDLEAALKAIEGDEQLDPYSLAYVKFTPSASNPHPEFADEVYFPPQTDEEGEEDLVMGPGSVDVVEVEKGRRPTQVRYRFPKSMLLAKKSFPSNSDSNDHRSSPLSTQSILLASLLKPQGAEDGIFSHNYNTPDGFREGHETRDEEDTSMISDIQQPSQETSEEDDDNQSKSQFSRKYNTPDSFREGVETRDEVPDSDNDLENLDNVVLSHGQFTDQYNTPDKFRQGIESRDLMGQQSIMSADDILHDIRDDNEIPESPGMFLRLDDGARIVGDEIVPEDFREQDSGKSRSAVNPELEELANLYYDTNNRLIRVPGISDDERQKQRMASEGKAYTEGGLVYLPEQNIATGRSNRPTHTGAESPDDLQDVLDDGLDALLDEYDALDRGFKRRERLDVKKPGPYFSTNNYAFQHHPISDDHSSKQIANAAGDTTANEHDGNDKKVLEASSSPLSTQLDTNKHPDIIEDQEHPSHISYQKKELKNIDALEPTSESGQYDIVDTTYAYVGFKDGIRTWREGAHIVKVVADLLGLEPSDLTHIRVDRNEVTFKVEQNNLGLNASDVAKKIEAIKDDLKKRVHVEVTSAGVGDKTKLPTVLSLGPDTEHELYVATFLLCGVIAAVLIAATALFVIRRHARSREKLQNLTAPDTEASKDYQELCRARMATKTQQEKPEPIHVGQRIASLSRESEGSNNSPSSRSSTSSWSEEPALTNMDISTGHMVLSYMEDHLKNKDRLEQEWVALCAYEAEPCATTIAQKAENMKKNRYPEVLPYDHARVVLNDLANISGSDYINASTITDHDPRNPAYIATQGPLPHTAPDFWQMVWEQGSVVMVMLTRLTENGTAMCHRYWPEEGSELYHIYEVHLVSEHIWCDDYLVRSFYLKNLKTGETRTVTQFHFLSWPDAGVPLSTKALLEFRRKVNKSYRGRSCPIVVHCSDGVGRTGTYCLIDMVLNRMAKGAKEIDIAATLEHIRDQRPLMVKTKQQFEFVLMAVAEEVHAILKALPSQQQQQQQQQQSVSASPAASSQQQQ
ncbi:receptor-type tyrosine-protein phosphatase N2 isoform X2 [Periplaneta americana]|uniref:receptor-type tyrosine-protein phosphatase N2 isoform X2 n=1 Tax=Periplaneta americana TaxID=6978 RepID=UPI0037E8DBCC